LKLFYTGLILEIVVCEGIWPTLEVHVFIDLLDHLVRAASVLDGTSDGLVRLTVEEVSDALSLVIYLVSPGGRSSQWHDIEYLGLLTMLLSEVIVQVRQL
jgi:hypothetical protein